MTMYDQFIEIWEGKAMDKKCKDCKWWAEDEMKCINVHNDVFMTGPGGSCDQWSAFVEED